MRKSNWIVITLVALSIIVTTLLAGCGSTPKDLTQTADFEGCQLSIMDAVKITDEVGENFAKVTATYTNNNSEPLYAYCSFKVSAFQNDKELEDSSDINGEQADLICEIKNGQTQQVTYLFKLVDESAIEVFVLSPTAEEVPLAKAVFG